MKTTKIKHNLVGLAALRAGFGLNQKLMAMYLKINISTLKLVETGRRLLPTHAFITIAHIEMQLAAKNEKDGYDTMHAAELINTTAFTEKCKVLSNRENKCMEDEKLLAGQLAIMKANYQKYRTRLDVIETMTGQHTGTHTELKEWQTQMEIVTDMLINCGIPMQLLAENRLEILRAEISLYVKLKLHLATTLPPLIVDRVNSFYNHQKQTP